MRILIVDDSNFALNTITKELKAMGVEENQIEQVKSGADALRRIETQTFDLFILDIVMPEIDGIAVLKEAKRKQPHAKIIMCSGTSSDKIIKELIDLGINAFLVKPFQAGDFVKAVARNISIPNKNLEQDVLIAKCHICDSEMIEVDLVNTISFYCPNSCMQVGPSFKVLVTQKDLDEDYESAKQKRDK
ncbi:MAG: response regulator [Negativicutes bacterium]|nr:response regulator [Negativicutes bacterium]